MAGAVVMTRKAGAVQSEGNAGPSTMIVQREVGAVSGAAEMGCRFGVVDVNGLATARAGQHPMPAFGVIV